ncbi:MAG: Flp family type IVb pilin [Pirellulales bacterium]
MLALWRRIKRFVRSNDGPTAVEYAVMLALILLVCLTAIQTFGTNTKSSFSRTAASLSGAAAS